MTMHSNKYLNQADNILMINKNFIQYKESIFYQEHSQNMN